MSIPNRDALTLLEQVMISHGYTVTTAPPQAQCDCGLNTPTIQHWRNHLLGEITKTGWTPPRGGLIPGDIHTEPANDYVIPKSQIPYLDN